MAPTTKLLRKTKVFKWTAKCQHAWEEIKQCYMDALILISLHWDIEFHVHTYASNLVVEIMLAQNLIKKCNQPIAYALQLLNIVEWNYTMIEREALAMVYVFHKFHHYLVSNKFIFYVDHMALLYLIQKPHVLGRISRWLLLFLEDDFTIIYKLRKVHFVVDVLSRVPNLTKESGVPNQTTNFSSYN